MKEDLGEEGEQLVLGCDLGGPGGEVGYFLGEVGRPIRVVFF